MTNYIYSTMTSDNIYAVWKDGPETDKGLKTIKSKVVIKGGNGVADEYHRTPEGVVTEVTDDELKQLQENSVFKRQLKGGFLHIGKRKADPKEVKKDMKGKDKSAPYTPDTLDEKAKEFEKM